MANYNVDYTDKRFTQVTADRDRDLNDNAEMYGEMMDRADAFYDAQIEASKNWADKQAELQQEQTDFAIEKIEQQKEQANKDYIKEQSGAYVDWQKQSDQYGAEAEKRAVQGLTGTGYSESSLVSMYNTYQNRVSNARESYLKAVQNYDNAMTEERLQNNAVLAELAAQALEQQLSLALEGFQYKNTLLIEKQNRADRIKDRFDTRWQNVLQQINEENALKEQMRQFNAQMAEEQRQYDLEYALEQQKLDAAKYQFDGYDFSDPSPEELYGGTSYTTTNAKAYKDAKNEHIAYKKATGGQQNSSVNAIGKAVGNGLVQNDAVNYLNALVNSGESASYILSEINAALRSGAITDAQAKKFKKAVNKG